MDEQTNFRLHIGGLGESVTSQDLEKRFTAFGTVIKVDGVGKLDANGFPLRYAFVEILSTDSQVKRCMNLLSGTTYKGSTLRIAPARPDYLARVERERANLPITTFVDPDEEAIRLRDEQAAQKLERKLAKFRARKRGIEGYESTNMELMTVKKFKSRQGVNGWKKDPETSLPIFPILTRPLRPLPSLVENTASQSNTKETADSTRALTRARRIRIDPTVYRAAIQNRKTHILGPRAISIEQFKLGFSGGAKDVKKSQASRLMWECQQLEENGELVWRLTDGRDVNQEERLSLSSYTLQKLKDPHVPLSSKPLTHQLPQSATTNLPRPTETCISLSLQTNVPPERQRHMSILRSLYQSSIAGASNEFESRVSDQAHPVPGATQDSAQSDPLDLFEHSELVGVDKSLDGSTPSSPNHQTERHQSSPTLSMPLSSTPTLRLRGGTSSKRPRRSHKRPKSPDTSSISVPVTNTDEISNHEALSAKLKEEHQRYLALASQTVTRPPNKNDVLEEVGQGTQAAVERQKLKEQRQGYCFEDPIEFVPVTELNHLGSKPHKFGSDQSAAIDSSDKPSQAPTSSKPKSSESDTGSESDPTSGSDSSSDSPETQTSPNLDSMIIEGHGRISVLKNERHSDYPERESTSAVRLSDLTDMFKAKEVEKTGFCLTDVLGEMELDNDILGPTNETENEASPFGQDSFQSTKREGGQPVKPSAFIHPSRLNASGLGPPQTATPARESKRKGPFFFYPIDDDPESKTIASLLTPEHRASARQHWLSDGRPGSSSDTWRSFIRTESISEIHSAHDQKKSTLTEHLRRKHKDAIKKNRKWPAHHQALTKSSSAHLVSEDLSSD